MSAERACHECGWANPGTAKFCAECGARLAPDAAGADVRKLVSLLFCDLVGSTALGERLDPEAFRQVQLRYYATCESALHRHRGTIEKFIGDAVLCVFGIPTAHEDDAHRACRAALDLIAGVEELNVELEADWGVRLAVRIGVNSGVVMVGGFSHGEQVVTGDPVNTAARLEQAAGAGEVLIGATTRELIGESGVCVPVPPLELKGKGGRVPSWRLVDMDIFAGAGLARATAPLVGREDELRRIESWLAERVGRPGMLAVLGPPGIGKSRLVGEAAGRASRAVHWGRCPSYGEEITYRLLADWLDAVGEEAVERSVGTEAAERLRFAVERSDTPATTDEIHRAAEALMRELGAAGDVLLVAEDVHWAEPPMLDLLVSLSRVPGVAILATARPEVLEARPGLASGPLDVRLVLLPLPPDAAEAMLDAVAGGVEDGGRIVAEAEGNPLLILQLALHVAEGGDPRALPPGLEAVLQARVERLSAEERAVAERGAVMGREFWVSGVAALAPEAPAPTAAIALLTGRQFVVEGRADGAPEVVSPTLSRVFSASQPYTFTHALLRDQVYESTPKLRRADLHERLGELLEQSGAAEELVAFHLERAARLRSELRPQDSESVAGRAADHLERAGERALARGDGDAARAFLTRAAALLDDGSAERKRIETSLAGSGRASAGSELVPGDVIGGFRIRAVAGRGGMGVVYRADDLALGRQVALKVIAPDLAGDARFRERFARESRIAAGLEHPNVVPVYGAGDEDGQLFIAMRFVDGTDLQRLLREGPLPADRAVAIVSQVADALDAAHRRGLVHRDVKPANVLVASAGTSEQAYLTDFGLTRDAAADGLTKTGQWVGTLAYIAPEQIRGEPVDARADIYALGAVLYQCVTGRPPFSVASELEALAAHLDDPPPRPSKDGAPRGLDGVVERAMSKDPARRFRSAGDLGRAAVAAVDGGRVRLTEQTVAVGAAAPTESGRRRRRQGRRGAAVVGLGVGVLAAGLAVVVALATGTFSSGGGAGSENAAGRLDGAPISLNLKPERLAVAGGDLWAMTTSSGRLARIDPEDRQVEYAFAPIDLGGGLHPDLAGGLGALWQSHANPTVGGVDRIDPATVEGIERIALPAANALAVGAGAVWATTAPAQGSGERDALARIDAGSNALVGSPLPLGRDLADVAAAPSGVWVVDRAGDTVIRLDEGSMRVRARITVGSEPDVVAVSPRAVWVVNAGDRTLTRIDPSRNEAVGAPVSLGKELEDILTTNGALWVAAADGTVMRLVAATGKLVGSPIPVGAPPLSLAWDGERLWVASATDQEVQAIRP